MSKTRGTKTPRQCAKGFTLHPGKHAHPPWIGRHSLPCLSSSQLKPSLHGIVVSFHGIIVVVSVIMVVVLSMGVAVLSSSESPQPCRDDTTNAAQMATSARQNFMLERVLDERRCAAKLSRLEPWRQCKG